MLTPKQEKFCLAYLETGSASEAYRLAYETRKMKPETVNKKAYELTQNGQITARLSELKKPVIEKAQLTLETHLERLDHLSRAAEAAEQYGAAITAETNRGKAAGLYTTKIETDQPLIVNVNRAIDAND